MHLQYTTITGSNDITLNIPYRNYNANNFMTALSSAILAADATFGTGFSIILNTTTNKFTLGHSTYYFEFMYNSTIVIYITGGNLLNSPY